MIIWVNATMKLPEYDVPVLAFCSDVGRMFVCRRVKNPDLSEYPAAYYWEDENVLDYIDHLNEEEDEEHNYVLYPPETVSWWCELPSSPEEECESFNSLDELDDFE